MLAVSVRVLMLALPLRVTRGERLQCPSRKEVCRPRGAALGLASEHAQANRSGELAEEGRACPRNHFPLNRPPPPVLLPVSHCRALTQSAMGGSRCR